MTGMKRNQPPEQAACPEQLFRRFKLLKDHRDEVKGSLPALQRLVAVAQADTGQSRIIGRFLLALYNGPEYPFVLTDMRGLDIELHQDCRAVLAMDYMPEKEVHELIENGGVVWGELVKRWGGV